MEPKAWTIELPGARRACPGVTANRAHAGATSRLRRGRQSPSPRYLLRLSELELLNREWRTIEGRIRQAKFEVVKTLNSFEFQAILSLTEALVLARRVHRAQGKRVGAGKFAAMMLGE